MANEKRNKPGQEPFFPDSPEMQEEWESFLANVSSRYGAPADAEIPAAPADTGPAEAPAVEQPAPAPAAPVRKNTRKKKKKKNRAAPVIACFAGIAVLLGVLAFLLHGMITPQVRLPENVSVNGVSIGGMKPERAAQVLQEAVCGPLAREEMTVLTAGQTIVIGPGLAEASVDLDALLADAGKEGAAELSLEPYLQLNEDAVRRKIAEVTDSLTYVASGFRLDGELPALDEENFDETAPCPSLLLTSGAPGPALDAEALYQQIRAGYCTGNFRLECSAEMTTPEPLDLDAVERQITAEPVNAALDIGTRQVTPGAYGIRFDREAAQKLLAQAAPGETVTVPLEITAPEVLSGDVWFRDVLGFCQTPHSDNEKRTKNLQLACASLNGVVIQPGETLSYNATLGRRTEENGYLPAPAYSGHELVDSIGGGICQVSSTLYLCSLYAELETVDRVSHGYPVNYIPIGTDATVSWGAPDLKLRNASEFPVKIMAEEKDGFVRIWILGIETRDYYVRVGFSSSSDRYARNYICKYDRETNERISREPNHLSAYLDDIEDISSEIGPNQIYRFGLPREQEIGEPMPETVEASRRHIPPNQFAEDA